jgi:hypothetical protein
VPPSAAGDTVPVHAHAISDKSSVVLVIRIETACRAQARSRTTNFDRAREDEPDAQCTTV